MKFKIIDIQKQGRITRFYGNYTYWIQGEGKWSLTDFVPHLLHAIKLHRVHALDGTFSIVYKADETGYRFNGDAKLRLEGTVDARLNRVHVNDRGIGFEDVNEYMRAAVEADVEHPLSDEEKLRELHGMLDAGQR